MLGSLLKNIFSPPNESKSSDIQCDDEAETAKKVLNVGGNNKSILIPSHYDGWEHILLDIDADANPDVVCDARTLTDLRASEYDSIYCSHNLEHYYRHDVVRVLAGFMHVLNDDGFAYIRVPDIKEVMRRTIENGLDVDDVLYQSSAGPITVLDVIYGYALEIEQSGNDFYAHKTGFTITSLDSALRRAGFQSLYIRSEDLEIIAIAFKNTPSIAMRELFNFPALG